MNKSLQRFPLLRAPASLATSRGNTLRFTTLFRDIERYCINDPEFLIFFRCC